MGDEREGLHFFLFKKKPRHEIDNSHTQTTVHGKVVVGSQAVLFSAARDTQKNDFS